MKRMFLCVQFSMDVKSSRSSSSQLSTIIIFQSLSFSISLYLYIPLALTSYVSITRHIYLGFCRYRDSRENRCCDAHPALSSLSCKTHQTHPVTYGSAVSLASTIRKSAQLFASNVSLITLLNCANLSNYLGNDFLIKKKIKNKEIFLNTHLNFANITQHIWKISAITSRTFRDFFFLRFLGWSESIPFSELGRENLWQLFPTWTDVRARSETAWIEMKQGPRAEEIHFLLRRLWKMRAQMCPDVYFGDNNSSARRRVISPFFSLRLSRTDFHRFGSSQIVETNVR